MNILGECIEVLKNLISYELKCLNRTVIPMNIGVLLFAVIAKATLLLGKLETTSVVTVLIEMLFYILVIVFIISVFLTSLIQFYKSMVTDEAYTTFSLPVDTRILVLAKLVAAVIVNMLSMVVTILSTFIMLIEGRETLNMLKEVWEEFEVFSQQIKIHPIIVVAFVIVSFVLTIITYNLFVETAIAVGQTFENNKVAYSVMGGIFIYLLATVLLLIFVYVIELFVSAESTMFYMFFFVALIISMLLGNVLMYAFISNTFTKKLNLE